MVDPAVEDKTIIITGANGRLGKVIARACLDADAHVVGVVRTEEKARSLQEKIPISDVFAADFTRDDEVTSCFAAIEEHVQGVDGVIHTVGTWTETPFSGTELAEWHRVMSVNVTSTWLCFQKAAPLMEEGGPLIAFSSAQGVDRGQTRQAAYGAAKAGVARLVETAAREFGDRGITAHAIAPSFIRYEESEGQKGVDASAIASYCIYLCGGGGEAVNGATVRMYGSAV